MSLVEKDSYFCVSIMVILFMKLSVVIVAGGQGKRMGSTLPKQFLLLNGRPMLMYTIEQFLKFDPTIVLVVVLPESQVEYWKNICAHYNFKYKHEIAYGGETRFHSVQNGIKSLTNSDLIAVHDGVRPLVSIETIKRCFEMAEKEGSAIPVIIPSETIRYGSMEDSVTVDRQKYFLVQTPQIFHSQLIHKAYKQKWTKEFTDDASVVEKMGHHVRMVEGNLDNIKITHPEELKWAEFLLQT